MKQDTETSPFALLASDEAFDPLEEEVRLRVRVFIETILEEELQAALGRGRYERAAEVAKGHRNGHRERQIIGTFGAETVRVPRARLIDGDGRASEWRSKALRRYQRLTKKAEALIASVYLEARAHRPVRRGGEQGRGQPGLAQGEDRLGGVVCPQPCRGRHRATDPRRLGGEGAA